MVIDMSFPKDICEDCPKRETCPDYRNPTEHTKHDFNMKLLRKFVNQYPEQYSGPIEVHKKPIKIRILKPRGKKMNIIWRP